MNSAVSQMSKLFKLHCLAKTKRDQEWLYFDFEPIVS